MNPNEEATGHTPTRSVETRHPKAWNCRQCSGQGYVFVSYEVEQTEPKPFEDGYTFTSTWESFPILCPTCQYDRQPVEICVASYVEGILTEFWDNYDGFTEIEDETESRLQGEEIRKQLTQCLNDTVMTIKLPPAALAFVEYVQEQWREAEAERQGF